MKKILLVTLISSFIIACGGGDGDASAGNTNNGDLTQQCANPKNCTEQEIIDILKLPAEPTSGMEGYDTIPGVDSNGINGRDDLERKIGLIYFPDVAKIKLLNYAYEHYAKQIDAGAENDVEKYRYHSEESSFASRCYSRKYGEVEDDSIWMSVSARQDRHSNGLTLDREMLRGYMSFLSVAELKEKCPKLIESLKNK